MNWIDIVVLTIVLRAGYIGALRGMAAEALKFIVVVLAVAVGVWGAQPTSALLTSFIPLTLETLELISFFGVVVLAGLAGLLLQRWLAKHIRQHATAWWNQALGGALGATSGLLLAGLVARALSSVPSDYLHTAVTQGSLTGGWALQALELVVQQVRHFI